MHATCPRPGLSSVEAKTKAVFTYAQMVANKGRGPTSLKKPPTSSTKITAAGGAPTPALKLTAATTPVATTEGPMGFVEALFGGGGGHQRQQGRREDPPPPPPLHAQGLQEWVGTRDTTPGSLPLLKMEGVRWTGRRKRPWKRCRGT